ncbi:MAG TPA: c-type cytochrome [Longimicrobiaceae bacterium]|nr:c-type cytochrome [Longimicrobiaceae bacterium]
MGTRSQEARRGGCVALVIRSFPSVGGKPGVGSRDRSSRRVPAVVGMTGVLSLALLGTTPALAQTAEQGREVYDRWCATCHGTEGRGDGPAAAYMLPRPRDFTRGTYQIKSTPTGSLPTDADILRIVDEGMPGTAMPGWRVKLNNQQRRAVVEYIKTFSPFFASEPPPEQIAVGRAPRATEEGLEEGRVAYDRLECWRCHGQQGRGDGPSAFEQADDDGFPVRPANLNQSWHFTGGDRPEDIYTRLMTGLEGTPMPSQADAVASGVVSEEQLWHLANYVRSLSPAQAPRIREVARATLVEGTLPASADDPAWDEAEEYFFPLAGQIIVRPRWFAPSVSGVWVAAMHNDEQLALRLRWHDPSQSPDPGWQEWQQGVLAAMEPNEGGPEGVQVLPDAFAVQFPQTIPPGMDRPFFLMGNAREPVYLWRWDSETDRAVQATAQGMDRIDVMADEQQNLTSQATWVEGEWRLLISRPLAAPEGSGQLTFETGRAIPIAFYAWDGDNSEAGTRGAISTWSYLYLDQPGSNTVYIFPIAATLLTFMLGLVFVVRAQRQKSSPTQP